MPARISSATERAIALWKRRKSLTIPEAAQQCGIHASTLARALDRMKIKRRIEVTNKKDVDTVA